MSSKQLSLNSLRAFLNPNRIVVLVLCVIFYGFWLFKSTSFPGHDYSNYYFGSYFFLQDGNIHDIFDPYTFNQKIFNRGYSNIFANFSPNPPFTLIFFIPFTLLPFAISKFAFNLITLVLFLGSVYRLCNLHNVPWQLVFLLLPILFFVPIRNEILFGQMYFLLFFLLAEGYIAYSKNNWKLSALLWGIAILLKVFPVIIFLFLILKKTWKPVIYLAISCFALFLLSTSIVGIDPWFTYFLEILPRANKGEIAEAFTTNYQSAFFLFKYAFISDSLSNPTPVIYSALLFNLGWILFKSLVLSFAASIILKNKDFFSFGILVLGSLLITPYGSTYSCLLLSFVLIASLGQYSWKQTLLVSVLIFLLSNLPISLFSDLGLLFQFPRLWLYVILLTFLFYISQTRFSWRALLFFSLLSGGLFFSNHKTERDSSQCLLQTASPVLIFDYVIEDGRIRYHYWNTEGSHEEFFLTHTTSTTSNQVSLVNNQIMLNGKQLTTSSDKKINAQLLGDNRVVYLSDKGRGPGFYTLRMIEILE